GGGEPRRTAARGATARAAHAVRSRDDRSNRLLRRRRKLFALSHRPQGGRAAADLVRIFARHRAGVRRREPRHRAADRRHVPRRLSAQIDACRIWLSPALVHGQPPLRFEEWDAMRPQTIYVSATPGGWELEQTQGAFAEQVIRPTGLIDPPVLVRPASTQVDDLVDEARKVVAQGYRVLVTTLTKRM